MTECSADSVMSRPGPWDMTPGTLTSGMRGSGAPPDYSDCLDLSEHSEMTEELPSPHRASTPGGKKIP